MVLVDPAIDGSELWFFAERNADADAGREWFGGGIRPRFSGALRARVFYLLDRRSGLDLNLFAGEVGALGSGEPVGVCRRLGRLDGPGAKSSCPKP